MHAKLHLNDKYSERFLLIHAILVVLVTMLVAMSITPYDLTI